MKIDIRGILEQSTKNSLKGLFNENGKPVTDQEARDYLWKKYNEGWLFIPMTDDCDNFDPKQGCLGHPIPEEVKD